MKYLGFAHDRKAGAIGIEHYIQIEFEAENDQAASDMIPLEFYKQGFEHISLPRFTRAVHSSETE